MARTVEVELQLDSQGAVQRIEAGGQAFDRLADSSDEASESLKRNEQAQREAGSAAERQASANREAAQAAERNETAQREAAQAAQRYAASTDRMAGAAGSANEVIFSTGDAIQDVQFGMAGAANNIAFVAENLAQMRQEGSGSTSVMQRLSGALMGPAGAILALQTLIALGPQIVSFFQSMEEGADSAIDSMEGLRKQMGEVLDLGELDDLGTDVSEIERQIQQLESALQKLQQREQELADQSETAVERTALSVQESIADFARSQGMSAEMVEQLGLAEGEAAERASQAATAQEELQVAIGEVNTRLQKLRGRLRAIRAVEGVAPDLVEENVNEEAEKLLDKVRDLEEISTEELQVLGLESFDLPDNLELAGNQAQRVEDNLLKATMQAADLQAVTGNALVSAFEQLGRSIAEGQSAMESFGQAAAGILSQIFQAIGTELIATGTALLATPGQQGTGAAYIAAGGTIIASAGALNAIGGGGGGASGAAAGQEAEGDEFEGGGEVSFGPPGRREGGPVSAGQLYETHGLGDREFFIPRTDGAVVTAGAMRAATRRQASRQTVDVRQQTDVSLDVSEPQLFDLSVALDEVRSFRQDFQQS